MLRYRYIFTEYGQSFRWNQAVKRFLCYKSFVCIWCIKKKSQEECQCLHSWLLKVQSDLVLITSNGFPWSVANSSCRRGWVDDGIMAVLQFLTGKKCFDAWKNIIIVRSFCWTQLFYVLMHSSQTAACPESLPVPREALRGSFHLGWTEHQVSGADCLASLLEFNSECITYMVSHIVYPCIMAVVNLSLFVIKANVYSRPSVLLLMGSIQKTQWQLC